MLRLLLRPRWIGLTLATLVVVVTCVRLGMWQLDRLQGRRDVNARFAAGLSSPALPLDELLVIDDSPAYRRALATGTYDPSHEVILYGRTLDGQGGNHVLTPLVLDDGRAILVDRGWVPLELDEPGLDAVAPPAGEVRVRGPLFAPQPGGAGEVQPGEDRVTTVRTVDVDAIADDVPYELVPWFLQLTSQSPSGGELPVPEPLPELDEGPHLSYAFQWFVFAAIAAIGYAVLVRRGLRDEQISVGLDPPRSDLPDPRPGHDP